MRLLGDGHLYWWCYIPILLSPFVLTWIYTSAQCHILIHECGPKVPTAPYLMPFLGHTIPFAWNTTKFLRTLSERFGQNPLRLLVGGHEFTYVPHGDTVLELFKKRDVNTRELSVKVMRDIFGWPEAALRPYVTDKSGIQATPFPGFEHVDPSQRVWYLKHQEVYTLLQGRPLNAMLEKFLEKYKARIAEKEDKIGYDEWTVVPDLFGMMKIDLFRAAMEALCGDHVFEAAPDLPEAFWEYDTCVPAMSKRLPRWLVPRHYAARDRALAEVQKWLDYAEAHFDWSDEKRATPTWDPVYGARVMRARIQMHTKVGFPEDAHANSELGLFWAINTNVIPTTFWTLLGILKSPNLKQRATAEIDKAFDSNNNLDARADSRGRFVASGYSGYSFPFGGGINKCPGRRFAKNEMIADAAFILRMYEIELVDPVAAAKVDLDMSYFPFGSLPPDRPVAVRMRRRRL